MRRFVPSKIQEESKIVRDLSVKDFVTLFIGLVLVALVLASSLPWPARIVLTVLLLSGFALSVMTFDMVKGGKLLLYYASYLIRRKKFTKVDIEKELKLSCDGLINAGGAYTAVIELSGIDFGILEERTQDEYISTLSEVLKEIKNGKIIKLEKPLDLTKFIETNDVLIGGYFEKQQKEVQGSEEYNRLQAKIEILELQNDQLDFVNVEQRLFVDSFYLTICGNAPQEIEEVIGGIIGSLGSIGVAPKRLMREELYVFAKLFFSNHLNEFNERDELSRGLPKRSTDGLSEPTTFGVALNRSLGAVQPAVVASTAENDTMVSIPSRNDSSTEMPLEAAEAPLASVDSTEAVSAVSAATEVNSGTSAEGIVFGELREGSKRMVFDGTEMRVMCLGRYPYFVGNAWGSEFFGIDGCKVVYSFCDETRKNVLKKISKSMFELRTRLLDKKLREDERLNYTTSYQSLEYLLEQLSFGGEKLHNTECYLIYPKSKHKEVLKKVRSLGIKINDLLFTQFDGWVSSLPFIPMPDRFSTERTTTLQSSTLAGMFPFVAKQMMDDGGYYLGASLKYPVFFNQFHLNNERVNHNMVILGKTGGGKSYFAKKTFLRFALNGDRVFILDPDNEYKPLCNNLHGNWIDVGGEQTGRINPLHVFASMRGDEVQQAGDVSSHRLFLSQFFQVVCPDMPAELMLYLNKTLGELYRKFNITDLTDLRELTPDKYPVFDDLLALVKEKQELEKDETEKFVYKKLSLYIEQFSGSAEGIYSRLWNGPTTLEIHNDFNVLNFQSLFANGNQSIANGQMLLLMRFLNQEVIKNRDANEINKTNRGIVIGVDEAHRFINPQFPIALDFMSTMAKQIRKYRGALIVATQNIADFVGVSEAMRAKASAVINACQYSMIFSLFADDINKVKDLYANFNGGLTQTEVDFLTNAKRGNALFVVDANTRMQVKIELYAGEARYIEAVAPRAVAETGNA